MVLQQTMNTFGFFKIEGLARGDPMRADRTQQVFQKCIEGGMVKGKATPDFVNRNCSHQSNNLLSCVSLKVAHGRKLPLLQSKADSQCALMQDIH